MDKIVGYAVSYHLKHNKIETSNSKDNKLVLTSERYFFLLTTIFPMFLFKSILSGILNYLLDSLKHGLNMLQSMQSDNKSSKKSLKVQSPTYCRAFW